MPFHYNLNVKPKVWCKPLSVSTSSMFLRFLVACPFFTLLLDAFAKWLQCHVRFNFGHPTRHLFLSIIVYKEFSLFLIINCFVSCCNASSCSIFPIYWNISEIMIRWAMTPKQYDKQLYTEKNYNAWKKKKKLNLQLYLLKWILILTMILILIECVH
jgi:hypothetical protein